MPKYRVTFVTKLPTGTPRFSDATPAVKEAYLAKVAEGKVIPQPGSYVNHGDGYTTTTTINVWNNKSDYESFKSWFDSNYTFENTEYYYSIQREHDTVQLSQVTTATEED
jgi:hypothetical protein